ncbi:MAG: hypothetical protein EOM68_03630 [Spirochaetia bacterium]|nr:hypothetical protein [Spirochaetia bacterium]
MFVSLELGDLGDIRTWQEHLSIHTGIPQDHIFLSVTHNHEAPHVSDDYDQVVVDEEKTRQFGNLVWNLVVDSAMTALNNAQKATVSFGQGTCDININRNLVVEGKCIMAPNPHGLSDKSVNVVSFYNLEGKLLAYIVNYAVHGVVMFDSQQKDGGMLISGDLPGAVSRILEERHDNQVIAIFTSGAAGDQIPRYMSHRIVHDGKGGTHRVDAGPAGWVLLDVQAENLADEVLLIEKYSKNLGHTIGVSAVQKIYTVQGQKKSERPMDIPSDYVYEEGKDVSMSLGVLMLGPLALLCIPAEPVCSIGQRLREALALQHGILITHCNGSLSYISDEYGYEHKAFEAVVSHFRRTAGLKALIQGFQELLSQVLGYAGEHDE